MKPQQGVDCFDTWKPRVNNESVTLKLPLRAVECSIWTRSIPCQWMPWLLESLGHQNLKFDYAELVDSSSLSCWNKHNLTYFFCRSRWFIEGEIWVVFCEFEIWNLLYLCDYCWMQCLVISAHGNLGYVTVFLIILFVIQNSSLSTL